MEQIKHRADLQLYYLAVFMLVKVLSVKTPEYHVFVMLDTAGVQPRQAHAVRWPRR